MRRLRLAAKQLVKREGLPPLCHNSSELWVKEASPTFALYGESVTTSGGNVEVLLAVSDNHAEKLTGSAEFARNYRTTQIKNG